MSKVPKNEELIFSNVNPGESSQDLPISVKSSNNHNSTRNPSNKFKKIAIAITGISFAGKSTFVRRLRTGNFVEKMNETMGLDIEFHRHQNSLFQLLDLGGQPAFRKLVWKNCVELSHGIIFVFDASTSGRETIELAREWFWRVTQWATNAKAIAFLANKWDLPHMTLEEVTEALDLQKFAKTPARSFRIFSTSNKTGKNINEAFEWLTFQVTKTPSVPLLVRGIYLFLKEETPFIELTFNDARIQDPQPSLNDKVFALINSFPKDILMSGGIKSIHAEDFSLAIVQRNDKICIVIIDKSSLVTDARMLAELILDFHQEQLLLNIPLNQVKNKVEDFCKETYNSLLAPD